MMMEKLEMEQETLSSIQPQTAQQLAGKSANSSDLAGQIAWAGFDAGGWAFFDNVHLLFRGIGSVLGAALSGLAEEKVGQKDQITGTSRRTRVVHNLIQGGMSR